MNFHSYVGFERFICDLMQLRWIPIGLEAAQMTALLGFSTHGRYRRFCQLRQLRWIPDDVALFFNNLARKSNATGMT